LEAALEDHIALHTHWNSALLGDMTSHELACLKCSICIHNPFPGDDMIKSQIQHFGITLNIPTQSADRTSVTSVSEDDEIKQINRDKDPEDDRDKALDDDAANEEEDDELEEEDEVQEAAKANRD
jgi:hypothetical protein